MEQQLLSIQIMSAEHGDKTRFYNPNDKNAVRKIKAFLNKKVKEGWHLYAQTAGEKDMKEITEFPNKIDDKKLDRFILAGHEKVSRKMAAQPITGG